MLIKVVSYSSIINHPVNTNKFNQDIQQYEVESVQIQSAILFICRFLQRIALNFVSNFTTQTTTV